MKIKVWLLQVCGMKEVEVEAGAVDQAVKDALRDEHLAGPYKSLAWQRTIVAVADEGGLRPWAIHMDREPLVRDVTPPGATWRTFGPVQSVADLRRMGLDPGELRKQGYIIPED